MQLRIDTSEIVAFQNLWEKFPEIFREELLPSIVSADLLIQGELQQQLPRGAGGLSGGAGLVGSVFTEETVLANNVIGQVGSPLPYAEYVEVGTQPHFPPLQPIQDWVQAKLGITEEAESRNVAFLIARAIARRGTKPDGTWKRVADATQPEVIRRLGEGIDRVLDRLGVPA